MGDYQSVPVLCYLMQYLTQSLSLSLFFPWNTLFPWTLCWCVIFLLRCISHTMQFTHLNVHSKGFWYVHKVTQSITFNFHLSPPKQAIPPRSHPSIPSQTPSPRQPLSYYYSAPVDLPICTCHIRGIIRCMVFCDWLLPCSMVSRFIHIVAFIGNSLFLLLNKIPLYGYEYLA